MKDKLTLTIDKKTLETYKKYCEERGMKVSAKVELFMKEELKNAIKKTK